MLAFAGRESDIGVLQMLHAWAQSALVNYAAPGWREEGGRALADGALHELRSAEPGSQNQPTWARFFAAVASSEEDFQLLGGLLEGTARIDGLDVDQELRWSFLSPLASHGVANEAAIDAELARDDTASGKRHHVRCLASRPSEAVKAQAWAAVVESDKLSNALVEATITGFGQPSQRELLAPYANRYFEVIERIWAERSIQIGMHVVRGCSPGSRTAPRPSRRPTPGWASTRTPPRRCGGWCWRPGTISRGRCAARSATGPPPEPVRMRGRSGGACVRRESGARTPARGAPPPIPGVTALFGCRTSVL